MHTIHEHKCSEISFQISSTHDQITLSTCKWGTSILFLLITFIIYTTLHILTAIFPVCPFLSLSSVNYLKNEREGKEQARRYLSISHQQ